MTPKSILHCILISLFSIQTQAKISNDVPPILPNVNWVDRIESYGCSFFTFRAFQPQSHGDLLEALSPFAEMDCAGPDWLLTERQILGRPQLQSEARVFSLLGQYPPLRLLGQEAVIDPIQSLREGRTVTRGPQIYTELNINSQLVTRGEWGLALSATPGWLLTYEDLERVLGKVYLQEGYIKAGYRRTEIVFGRLSERFGEAKYGNLLLSGAQKPLNVLKLSVRPHWIAPFSFMGPMTFQTWIGSDQSQNGRRNASLWALQWGARPFTFLEFGFLNLMQFGGEGSPSLEFSDYFKMLIASTDPELENRRHQSFATHLGIWGPQQKIKLYQQFLFGKLRKPSQWFSEDVSWLVGLWFPKIGAGDLRFEWVNTRNKAYSHPLFTQGWSHDQTPLGHPIGNGGQAVYADISLPLIEKWRPQLGLSFEERNRDQLFDLSHETRWGFSLSAIKRIQALEWDLEIKGQQVENKDYVEGESHWEAGGFVSLRYSFL